MAAFGPKSGLNKDEYWFIDSLNVQYFVIRRHFRLLARKALYAHFECNIFACSNHELLKSSHVLPVFSRLFLVTYQS